MIHFDADANIEYDYEDPANHFESGVEWADEHPSDENIINFINKTENDEIVLNALWNDNKNKVIEIFNKKGYGIYDEIILDNAFKEENSKGYNKAIEDICNWLEDNAWDYLETDYLSDFEILKKFEVAKLLEDIKKMKKE